MKDIDKREELERTIDKQGLDPAWSEAVEDVDELQAWRDAGLSGASEVQKLKSLGISVEVASTKNRFISGKHESVAKKVEAGLPPELAPLLCLPVKVHHRIPEVYFDELEEWEEVQTFEEYEAEWRKNMEGAFKGPQVELVIELVPEHKSSLGSHEITINGDPDHPLSADYEYTADEAAFESYRSKNGYSRFQMIWNDYSPFDVRGL